MITSIASQATSFYYTNKRLATLAIILVLALIVVGIMVQTASAGPATSPSYCASCRP